MCLIIKPGARFIKARKDKVVYKIVEDRAGKLTTPFMHTHVEIGKSYKTKEKLKIESETEVYLAIHSFVNQNDTIAFARKIQSEHRKFYVVQCIIPKGSIYIKGEFRFEANFIHYSTPSYASDTLKYEEILVEISN